jgi:hypothetical protein
MCGALVSMGEAWNTHTELLPENLKSRNHLRHLRVHGRIILQWMLQKQDMRISTGFICFRTEARGGVLWSSKHLWIVGQFLPDSPGATSQNTAIFILAAVRNWNQLRQRFRWRTFSYWYDSKAFSESVSSSLKQATRSIMIDFLPARS